MGESMSRERGIIFSGESVRAIFAGRKTTTRRVVKPRPTLVLDAKASVAAFVDRRLTPMGERDVLVRCPYGAPGDQLWVRETWRGGDDTLDTVNYRADADGFDQFALTWRSPIFMPRRFSRLTLEITSVRVERLQEITEEDVVREGLTERLSLRDGFADGWDSLNGKRAPWESDPWVWAIGFEVTR